jgi:hypothetical protein
VYVERFFISAVMRLLDDWKNSFPSPPLEFEERAYQFPDPIWTQGQNEIPHLYSYGRCGYVPHHSSHPELAAAGAGGEPQY